VKGKLVNILKLIHLHVIGLSNWYVKFIIEHLIKVKYWTLEKVVMIINVN